ncbi:MAG: 50S ribosomal protein L2 [Patescibacteria group bacterium]
MAIKYYKPTTSSRRKGSVQDFSDITKTKSEKSLIRGISRRKGRNNTGRITVRHRGGGVKRLYRMVDFKRARFDIPAEVIAIEYDPNRNARIALIQYEDGVKSYILGGAGFKVGDKIISTKRKVDAQKGVRMPLENIPVGLFVYNVELEPDKGGQIVRSAGTGAQLQTVEGKFAQLKLPSGEVRLVKKECMATIGMVGNPDIKLVRLGKAGRMRHRGWRPTVKGKNMNPVDHPHGGGEGHSPIGMRKGPKTPWGKKAMGLKTRKRGKKSNRMIVSKRKK